MPRIITAAKALSIIQNHNALIKNIQTDRPSTEPAFDDPKNGWGFIIRQLKDPENYRPVRDLPPGVDRTKYFDPEQIQWFERQVNEQRGQPRPGIKETKALALTLMPREGGMNLFPREHGIAILLAGNECTIKNIFDKNIRSNDKWWLYGAQTPDGQISKPLPEGGRRLPVSCSLDEIRQQHIQKRRDGLIPDWNEILAKVSAEAVIAVAVPKNDLIRRLNAQ